MTKKLKIRFVKFERALVVQQLEIEGDFKNSPHVSTSQHDIGLFCDAVWISVGETRIMNEIAAKNFDSNRDRDEYLERVVKWISEEQFSTKGKLKIGKECEFSDNGVEWYSGHFGGKCAKELGEPRFLAAGSNILVRFKNARPIGGCVRPKINGDVYTWEMEVADER